MEKILSYTLQREDLEKTAGGLVNLVLRECVRVTGHEISSAKFADHGITCDGKPIHVSERMLPGQTLRILLPEDRGAEKLVPVKGPVRILYEDEDLIAVDKAAGEVVHPCPGHYADTVANYLTYYLQEKRGQDRTAGEADPQDDGPSDRETAGLRIIGRLDKETSGVLVFARSRAAAARLQRQRQEGQFVRTYCAVCEGLFPEDRKRGIIDSDMEKIPGVLMKMRICEKGKGLHALTRYEVITEDRRRNRSVLRCRIDTGRTHQIRVHLAGIGHPLVGDTLYGTAAASPAEQVKSMADGRTHALLTAVSVECLQPFTGEKLCIRTAHFL